MNEQEITVESGHTYKVEASIGRGDPEGRVYLSIWNPTTAVRLFIPLTADEAGALADALAENAEWAIRRSLEW